MTNSLKLHIDRISAAISEWLHPGNFELMEAIDRTVNEKLFSFSDIKHQILALKSATRRSELEKWAKRSGLIENSLGGKRVLCLHAGNIPLVGFQDLLAVLLTGGHYVGKISNKDPYLLPTFLNKAKKHRLLPGSQWNTNLQELTASKVHAVLFAGSMDTADIIRAKLRGLGLTEEKTPHLMRTSHFSIAYIPETTGKTMEDLTEAVFRYGGSGCRSVAMVVSPHGLKSIKCEFTDYIERFWLNHPQQQKPPASLFHRFAFNKATGIEQAWLDDFLIEENQEHPNQKFILYWIQGSFQKFENVASMYQNGLQSLYSTANYIGTSLGRYTIEPLSQAQNPPIWWKPDQVDSIRWLQEKVAVL